jgi:hypothetical protein
MGIGYKLRQVGAPGISIRVSHANLASIVPSPHRASLVPSRRTGPRILRDCASRPGEMLPYSSAPDAPTSCQPVASEEFLEWLQISLDIRDLSYPSSVVETSLGDLLFDQSLHGRIYVHGVIISGTNPSYPFKLGYNFTQGKFTRDWRWLMDRRGMAERVYWIWESALQAHEDVLLPIYISLLRNTPAPMDVDLAVDLLLPSTISRIWTYLLHESKGKEFFYCETSGAQVCRKSHTCIAGHRLTRI